MGLIHSRITEGVDLINIFVIEHFHMVLIWLMFNFIEYKRGININFRKNISTDCLLCLCLKVNNISIKIIARYFFV